MSFLIDYSYCYNVMLHLLFITTNVSCFIGYSYANSISSSIGLNILMLPVSCFIGFHSYHCVMLCWLFTSITVSCSIDYSQLLMCHAPLVIHMLQCFILHWLFSFYQFHASFVIHSYYCVMLHWLFTAITVSCSIGYSQLPLFHVTLSIHMLPLSYASLVIPMLPESCFIGYLHATTFMLHWFFTVTTVSCYIGYSHVATKLCFVGYSYATRVMLYWLFTCYHCVMLHCLFRLMQQPCHAP